MRQILMILLEDRYVNVSEDFLDTVEQYLIDEITKGMVGGCFPVHEIHFPHVDPVLVFQFQQRAVSLVHKRKQFRSQHIDRIIPVSPDDALRVVFRYLLSSIPSLHQLNAMTKSAIENNSESYTGICPCLGV